MSVRGVCPFRGGFTELCRTNCALYFNEPDAVGCAIKVMVTQIHRVAVVLEQKERIADDGTTT